MHPGALRALEFDQIVEAVRRFAHTPPGAARLGRMQPSPEASAVAAALNATAETVQFLQDSTIDLRAPADLEDLLAGLAVDGRAIEPRDLLERGFRYVKAPASLLLSEAASPGIDIHAADLSDLLGRHGISLIAERIETETQVVNLLDYDVRFGQGFLFSPPRPVRPEALQGSAESSAPARSGADRPQDRPAPSTKAGAAF